MGKIIERALSIDLPRNRSAFLWGPRKVGKTYWIHHFFKKGGEWLIDLLETDTFAEYVSRPALLRERWRDSFTIIDEVQKVPALLDEVHWLIEHKNAQFLLTGSSARKLRRGHANLLGGRAWRFEMGALSLVEIDDFELENIMISGLIPDHFLSSDPLMDLRSYVSDYLREEIVSESLVNNIPAFSDFLRVAALTNGELVNYTNIGRETGVSPKVVRRYFEILEDTLLGFRLGPWRKSPNRRMITTEKFYFFDVGVTNFLSRRKPAIGTSEFGKSFEQLVLLELLNYKRYKSRDLEISYWRTSTGIEVDFILNDMQTAIEVKGSRRTHDGQLRAFKRFEQSHKTKHKILVCLEEEPRRVGTIDVLPLRHFLERLWGGEFD